VARSETLDTWRIEVEKTNRFQRSRMYRLGGPRSLTWEYEPYEDDGACQWPRKLRDEHAVAPWPAESWASEHAIPRGREKAESSYWKLIQTLFFGGQVEGFHFLRQYVDRMVDEDRLPKCVRIEYQQTEYRCVCTVTVLEWGRSNKNAETSMSGFVARSIGVYTHSTELFRGNAVDRALFSINGVKLDMTSEEVLAIWQTAPSESHVFYDPSEGLVILAQGDSLLVDGRLYRTGDDVEPLLEQLVALGFEDYEFPIPKEFAEKAEELREQFRAECRLFLSRDAVLSLKLENGTFKDAVLSGLEGAELHDGIIEPLGAGPRRDFDWVGPEPTIHGISLEDNEEIVIGKLGPPHGIHQSGEVRTLCYNEDDCEGADLAEVDVHITFENDRCRQIRGNQFEQAGRLKMGAGFPMPPPHSRSEVAQTLFSSYHALAFRPAKETEGPVSVVYNFDLGMQVWIYPDGRKQFLLQRVELPETIVDMELP